MNSSKAISLVLTVIGDDRPGLVEQLATAISKHDGNWLESSMAHLSGKFAGIVCIGIPEARLEALKTALSALPGLRITAEVADADEVPADKPSGRRLKLSLVGHDRIGIVREVSSALAALGGSSEAMNTLTYDAPMGDGKLFGTDALLVLPEGVTPDAGRAALEGITAELMVDVLTD